MNRYDKETLEELILAKKISYSQIGKLYGVTGSAIKKAARRFGIELPVRRYINPKENFSHSGTKSTSLVNRVSDEEFIRIIKTETTWIGIGKRLGYKTTPSSNVKHSIEKRCDSLGVKLNINYVYTILEKTKGELFRNRKNWQSARSAIQKSARWFYRQEVEQPKCAVCGYDKHVEVAHIKGVSEFEDEAKVREINSIDNLIGLCPNHHWEYDNGILDISPYLKNT